jgi:hypothetical protein
VRSPESAPVGESYEPPALHVPAHLSHSVGSIHGPVHTLDTWQATRRYVHPQAHTIMEAIERARNAQGGHKSGHTSETAAESAKPSTAAIQ